jgi:hypothetical protein
VRSERQVGVELAEGSDAVRLRASDHHGSTRGVPAGMPRGLRRLESYRRREIEGAAVLGWNSGATRVGVVREELGELPGGEAKLMWGLAGDGVQRGGRSTVRQGALRGGASGQRLRV